MDNVAAHALEDVSRWWFQLRQIFSLYSPSEKNNVMMLESLCQFVEDSPLGEFEARLDMLRNFYGQMMLTSGKFCLVLPNDFAFFIFVFY